MRDTDTTRRWFLLVLAGLATLVILFYRSPFLIEFVNGLRSRFQPEVKVPPAALRAATLLPVEGSAISVETALNSRCCSDHDENPNLFHWGMFDKTRHLSDDHINSIINHVTIPMFTDVPLELQLEENTIRFIVADNLDEQLKGWANIESGMQQQAVCLTAAALGSGVTFQSMGLDGRPHSSGKRVAVNIIMDAMKPSFGGGYWSTLPPEGMRPWVRGNLPDPMRKGSTPLMTAFDRLSTFRTGVNPAGTAELGQLLWAARGRTPHLYLSKAWGLTIPTQRGKQDITSLYLCSPDAVRCYVNWSEGNPTHHFETFGDLAAVTRGFWRDALSGFGHLLVLARNDDYLRSYWEIGYQLLNVLLQATVLDLSYKTILLDKTETAIFDPSGIRRAAAVVAIR